VELGAYDLDHLGPVPFAVAGIQTVEPIS